MFTEHLHTAWLFIEKWYWVPLTIANIVIIVTILIENRNPPKNSGMDHDYRFCTGYRHYPLLFFSAETFSGKNILRK